MSSPVDYSAPQPPQQPYAQPEKKGLAVAALVLGILAIVGCLIPILNVGSIILGLVGLILGIVAIVKAKKPGIGGKGMAIAGTILSVLAIVGAIIVNAVVVGAANEVANDPAVQQSIEDLEDGAAPSAPAEELATEPPAAEAEVVEPEAVVTDEPEAVIEPEEEAEPEGAVSQDQAARKAEQYLGTQAFSEEGLATQLEFEGFSPEEAAAAAAESGADWNEQAAQKAQQYLDTQGFSADGLQQQLEFEGFTPEQAAYGVESVGL